MSRAGEVPTAGKSTLLLLKTLCPLPQLTSANTPPSNPNSLLSQALDSDWQEKKSSTYSITTKVPGAQVHCQKKALKLIKMGEESGYSWFCWRRSPATYSAAPKIEVEPELNPSPLQLQSPLQRASGTVLVELVELPIGPFSISTSDINNNNNNNGEELSNGPTSHHTSYSPSTSAGPRLPSTSISSSMSSISSSSLPPYSELVKELGAL